MESNTQASGRLAVRIVLDGITQDGLPIGDNLWVDGVTSTPVSEVLNRDIFSRLQQATATQPGVLAELCHDYVAEARSTISQLRNALAQGNAAEVRERAHYLKGSSMMLGAQQLSQTCATLELMGRDSNLATAAPVLEQAMTSLRELEMVLKEVVGPTALPAEGSAA
jgi:HPt (histidine-containing phosphotransfer) domain-containing protein